MKTAELEGAELDYWVAEALNFRVLEQRSWGVVCEWKHRGEAVIGVFAPSTDWSHSGPLIEQYGIELWGATTTGIWGAGTEDGESGHGPTPLIAVCRAIVASVYGDEVADQGEQT